MKEIILNISPQHPDYPISLTHLFSTNMPVDQHNHDVFRKSSNEKVDIKAIDIVLGDLSDDLKERLKNKSQTILRKPRACTQYAQYLRKQNITSRQTCQF